MTAPNWVQARADCTLESNFQAIADQVSADVKKFNGLKPEVRNDRLFIVEKTDAGIAVKRAKVVFGYRASKDGTIVPDEDFAHASVSVEIRDGMIVAEAHNRPCINVFPKWSAESLSCDMYVGDEVVPVWNVSERILEPFLFGD